MGLAPSCEGRFKYCKSAYIRGMVQIRISESIFDSIDPHHVKFVRIVVLTISAKVSDAIKKGGSV